MVVIDTSSALARALTLPLGPRMAALLLERQRQLGGEIAGQARFLVLEPGDTRATLAAALEFEVFGDPDRSFSPEWVADHGYVLEAVWLLTDDGFAHVAWVRRIGGIDRQLIELLEIHAAQHA